MKERIPLRYQPWFIAILLLAWPVTMFISTLLGLLFIYKRSKKYNLISKEKFNELSQYEVILDSKKEAEMILQSAKEEADKILSQANKEVELFENINKADDILIEAQNQAEEILENAKQEAEEIKENTLQEKYSLKASLKELSRKVEKLKQEEKDYEAILKEKSSIVIAHETTVDFTDNITSNELKNTLSILQIKEKELIADGKACRSTSYDDDYKKREKQSKKLLRAFNAETDYYLTNVRMNNVDTYRNKITNTFSTLNRLFSIDNVQITKELLNIKLEKLDATYKYYYVLEQERELLKAKKEEMREQQRVEKELQIQKDKILKEENQFRNEVVKLMKYLESSNTDIEKELYADKIKELEDKIKELEKDKKDVENRETNTRAGFVYIISNIGSFGENVYKIGMTRRLEPMDRISELSSASVPFPFDVHALIFSEDAPALETTLHNYFRKQEVNKVNSRKEFFRVNLEEIKDLVHKEFNNTVHFTDVAVAEQYRETLRIESTLA
ncbi:DUF4041 domain-containing protein [Streptococcus vestibularis]|jgi:hypothetical protein|nr:MAG TPA: helicase [Caudoviricetes sp.]